MIFLSTNDYPGVERPGFSERCMEGKFHVKENKKSFFIISG